MENTFAFPSIHYSQFKRINLPNARPRSHYSKPPVAPRCLLKSKHLSLTLKPRHKPAPTHSLSPPLPATRNNFCSKCSSCFCLDWTRPRGSTFLKCNLRLRIPVKTLSSSLGTQLTCGCRGSRPAQCKMTSSPLALPVSPELCDSYTVACTAFPLQV